VVLTESWNEVMTDQRLRNVGVSVSVYLAGHTA